MNCISFANRKVLISDFILQNRALLQIYHTPPPKHLLVSQRLVVWDFYPSIYMITPAETWFLTSACVALPSMGSCEMMVWAEATCIATDASAAEKETLAHVLGSLKNVDAIRTFSKWPVFKLRGGLKKYIFAIAAKFILTSKKLIGVPCGMRTTKKSTKLSIDGKHNSVLARFWRLIDVCSRAGS